VPAYFLVNRLNEVLERFTGTAITRSTKRPDTVEYVKAVCRIADPSVGDGTIIEAVKKAIKYYKPFGGILPERAGVISPPIAVGQLPIRRYNRPSELKTGKRRMKD
jgi:hypothetical protein